MCAGGGRSWRGGKETKAPGAHRRTVILDSSAGMASFGGKPFRQNRGGAAGGAWNGRCVARALAIRCIVMQTL